MKRGVNASTLYEGYRCGSQSVNDEDYKVELRCHLTRRREKHDLDFARKYQRKLCAVIMRTLTSGAIYDQ